MSDCRNDCVEPFEFPKKVVNPPGLDHVDYRIGTYCRFLEAMQRDLNRDEVLQSWTYRKPDDPAIALLEGAAILGDILTFYQEHYANETWLRTARRRESIADLVKLLGYRLSPGVGGSGLFAFEVKGDRPVTVPAGFPFKATLEGSPQPAFFETEAELSALPALSQFHLYRPRIDPGLTAGLNQLELRKVGVKQGVSVARSLDLQAGDRIMLVSAAEPDQSLNTMQQIRAKSEILIIAKVEHILDRTILTFEGGLSGSAPLTAYRIGRSFGHFGRNAPSQLTRIVGDPPVSVQEPTKFERRILEETFLVEEQVGGAGGDQIARQRQGGGGFYSILKPKEMPLDVEVDDLAEGGRLICQGWLQSKDGNPGFPFTVVKNIRAIQSDSLTWGNLSGPATVVTIDSRLVTGNLGFADIRKLRFHEVTSPLLELAAPAQWQDGLFGDGERTLFYFGTHRNAQTLAGRTLLLQKEGEPVQTVTVTSQREDFSLDGPGEHEPRLWPVFLDRERTLFYFGTHRNAQTPAGRTLLLQKQGEPVQTVAVTSQSDDFSLEGRDEHEPRLWPVVLDRKPAFPKEDFDEAIPAVTVFGNLAPANQGKSEREEILGNGDSRRIFQTFRLPKAPLTYHNVAGETPPETPELRVYVDNILWERVPSLFGRKPDDRVYIVREDSEGAGWIQFGDGKTGKRLPSGLKNVVARFRTGSGAFGPIQPETNVQAQDKLDFLKKIRLPGVISGGEPPESGDNAREAAPGKIRGLGRLVSIEDYEHEALGIPGVAKAQAVRGLVDNTPVLTLTVLLERGREREIDNVRRIMEVANRGRGPRRFPIKVIPAMRRYLWIAAEISLNPVFREDVVKEAVRRALGLGDETNRSGLFAPERRAIGEPEYATRIAAVIQNVAGVVWARVTAFHSLGKLVDPASIKQSSAIRQEVVSCDKQHLLALFEGHLELAVVAVPETEVRANET